MQFRQFVESKDIFGFDYEQQKAKPQPQLPIDPIDSEIILDELQRHSIGNKKPYRDWHDMIEWGKDQYGAIKAEVSPLGSYKMIIRRMIKDLQGESVWICKKIFPFNENEHNDNELSIALDLYEQIKKVDQTLVEAPSSTYDHLEKLVRSMMNSVRHHAPEIMVFEGARKIDQNNYLIYLSYRGHGVEAPSRHRAEQFNINVQFNPIRGLVRCWGCEVLSQVKMHDWKLQPSEWHEYFSPAQDIQEIIEAVIAAFKTY